MARTTAILAACTITAAAGVAAGVHWHSELVLLVNRSGLVHLDASTSMRPTGASEAAPTAEGATAWYCPMHPSYRSDHPGDCPICNMKLIPLEEGTGGAAAAGVAGHATITLSQERRQLIGVRTGSVARRKVEKTVHAVGRVEIDERRRAAVNLKFAGWIEKLEVRAVGDAVKKGDPLLSVYSPELYEAQRSYLVARKTLHKSDPTVASARERLRLLDLTDEQIAVLEGRDEPERLTTILSRVAGTVVQRNVVEGGAVEPGKDLFEIADLSMVWVVVDVYASEIPFVRVGDEAAIALAGSGGDPLRGRVEFLYPTLNETTRTVRARIAVPNHDGALKPGMYADATILVDLGVQLVIDGDAILDTGTRQIVFVEPKDGQFEPREIVLGDRSDGHAVVLKGLVEGERIVTSANFLIDSESRLQAALRSGMQGMAGMEGMDHAKDMKGMPASDHEKH